MSDRPSLAPDSLHLDGPSCEMAGAVLGFFLNDFVSKGESPSLSLLILVAHLSLSPSFPYLPLYFSRLPRFVSSAAPRVHNSHRFGARNSCSDHDIYSHSPFVFLRFFFTKLTGYFLMCVFVFGGSFPNNTLCYYVLDHTIFLPLETVL